MKRQVLLVCFILFLLASCRSKDGDYTFFSAEEDLALGRQVAAQIDNNPRQFPILEKADHPELYSELELIRDQVLKSGQILHRNEFAWELKVIENDSISNAFCTPGGF